MINTKADKIAILIIIILSLFVPATTFLVAKRSQVKNDLVYPSKLNLVEQTQTEQAPEKSPLEELKQKIEESTSSSTAAQILENPNQQTTVGSSLAFKLSLEGRSGINDSTKAFVGIAQGEITPSPEYLISFVIDLNKTGQLQNLSVSGLTNGETYTAYIKGFSQLATAVSFVMKPTVNDLGLINLSTGDLNEDNIVDSTDLTLAKKSFGSTPSSANWNSQVDFNLDGTINNGDLAILAKNLGKVGASGLWSTSLYNTTASASVLGLSVGTQQSTASGKEATPSGELPSGQDGYWLWVPQL